MGYRKCLAIFITVVMILALFPTTGFANEPVNDCDECKPYFETILYAGQDIEVGKVIVTNDGEKLCIKYELSDEALEDGWLIYETHWDVGKNLSDIPQTQGNKWGTNPIPGQFDYGDDELGGVEFYEECIDIPDDWDWCDDIYIAAHAVVKRMVNEAYCDTVVEAGDDFFVSDTSTLVVGGGNALLAHKPGDAGSPYGNVWDTNLDYSFDNDAEWIWDSYYVANPIYGDVVTFEKEFNVPGPPLGGTLYIAADNGFAAYLNGELLGSFNLFQYPELGDLKQPYVNTTDWWYVQNYDLAADLFKDTNTLTIVGVNEYMDTDDVDKAGNPQRVGDIYWNPGGVIFEFDVEWDKVQECYPEVWEDQTAWGFGNPFNQRGNWGWWFNYKLCPPVECVPAKTIYGVTGNGSTGGLYQIEITEAGIVETELLSLTGIGGATNFYANGLAYDDVNHRLYFAIRKSGSATSSLYFWDFLGDPVLAATGLTGDVYGATWGAGMYWFIPNGSNTMRTVSFDAGGINGTVEIFEANFAGGKSFNFGDMALDAEENVIYVSTSFSGTNKEFFKYDLNKAAGGRYSVITTVAADKAIGLQLGFGEDGVLYGHSTFVNALSGSKAMEWFAVNKAGTATSLGLGEYGYNDLATGPFVCD